MEYLVLVAFKVLRGNLGKLDTLDQLEDLDQLDYQELHQTLAQQVQ
jgi:hypothetical protein